MLMGADDESKNSGSYSCFSNWILAAKFVQAFLHHLLFAKKFHQAILCQNLTVS